MTKAEFERYFKSEILPLVAERYEQDGIPDKPARREAWNDTVDAYIQDGILPQSAGDWSHPRWLETLKPQRAKWARYSVSRRRNPAGKTAKRNPARLRALTKI